MIRESALCSIGSDYLLGVSAFSVQGFAARDR